MDTSAAPDLTASISATVAGFQTQLVSIIKSDALKQDYTLLNGFLSFAHSKLNKIMELALSDIKSGKITQAVPFLLDLSWEKLWYPIFKWFQAWRASLLMKTDVKGKPNYIEFRRMSTKANKFAKFVLSIYNDLLIQLLNQYATTGVISESAVIEPLSLAIQKSAGKEKLDKRSSQTSLIVFICQRCTFYMASVEKYKAISGKLNNKFAMADFAKAMELLHISLNLSPSFSEVFFQRGLIYIQCNNFGLATYEFLRGCLTSTPSVNCINSFQNIMFNEESSMHQRLTGMVKHIHKIELHRERFVNREIIEYYFLPLLGSILRPNVWIDANSPRYLKNTKIDLKDLELMMFEKLGTRYSKSIDTIFKNLMIVLSCFHIIVLLSKSSRDPATVYQSKLSELNVQELLYLKFAFKYINHIFENIIYEVWDSDFETFQYLAMVRVSLNWMNTNKSVLQYAQSELRFCQNLTRFVNFVGRSNIIPVDLQAKSQSPKRQYCFQEDIISREFSPLKYALTDSDDSSIFGKDNSIDTLLGSPLSEEKLDCKGEAILRLESIISLSKTLLEGNTCGFEINGEKNCYFRSRKTPDKKIGSEFNRNQVGSGVTIKPRVITKVKEIKTLQPQAPKQEDDVPNWGYSGSSVPVAPSTIDVKPSFSVPGTPSTVKKDRSDMAYDDETDETSTESSESSSDFDMSTIANTLEELNREVESANMAEIFPPTRADVANAPFPTGPYTNSQPMPPVTRAPAVLNGMPYQQRPKEFHGGGNLQSDMYYGGPPLPFIQQQAVMGQPFGYPIAQCPQQIHAQQGVPPTAQPSRVFSNPIWNPTMEAGPGSSSQRATAYPYGSNYSG
ncbi:Ebs1p KNAG_0A04560 [Huiozyma naganishii CBS 8797]|uniref:Protein EBS1 n=1 Tax=Huiozyma naganishii (strain ATCC MYA-139 / BCRC 22969 / CBS 8797 / KCTC 17520 / NBRC 10181 / NCYC 3082 / Yp74L-3) TaxID=1071383 RepID=J7REZ1_HUIN7|nr:hypothetical protein KNAG_0A04560 [Kazachstania naganishii CBS 8797]CCK68128.1 hypothetical protein KNAG_0A04560 [Kazachstania naganishii CBS 8797]